jgi:phosphatidylethanolamine/phosphatidyl-N-methylethanolamine N-methyltransferase
LKQLSRTTGVESILLHPFGCEYAESPRWNPFERLYIRLFGQVDLPTRMRARLIIKALHNVPWKTMLDFGSGTGAYSFYFSRSPKVHVWGMDIDRTRISECLLLNRKLKRKSVDFVCCSRIFETSRFQPDSMDIVLAVEVLHDLPDIKEGLHEIRRVLKPGGYLVSHIPLRGYRGRPEEVLFDTEKLVSILNEAGLEPVSITRTFGKTASFLAQLFSHFNHSRSVIAIIFPMLLLASLPLGGENSGGNHCVATARKKTDDRIE